MGRPRGRPHWVLQAVAATVRLWFRLLHQSKRRSPSLPHRNRMMHRMATRSKQGRFIYHLICFCIYRFFYFFICIIDRWRRIAASGRSLMSQAHPLLLRAHMFSLWTRTIPLSPVRGEICPPSSNMIRRSAERLLQLHQVCLNGPWLDYKSFKWDTVSDGCFDLKLQRWQSNLEPRAVKLHSPPFRWALSVIWSMRHWRTSGELTPIKSYLEITDFYIF